MHDKKMLKFIYFYVVVKNENLSNESKKMILFKEGNVTCHAFITISMDMLVCALFLLIIVTGVTLSNSCMTLFIWFQEEYSVKMMMLVCLLRLTMMMSELLSRQLTL